MGGRRSLRAAVWALLLATCAVAASCGGAEKAEAPDASGGASGDASVGGTSGTGGWQNTTGGTGGTGGSKTEASTGKQCKWPFDVGDPPDASLGLQAWCEPNAVNPPECPAQKPVAGTACPSDGLACGYDLNAGDFFSLLSCKSKWSEVGHYCGKPTCAATSGGSQATLDTWCGTVDELQCLWTPAATRYEALKQTLRGIASCCGLGPEDMLAVWFEKGCAVRIRVGRDDIFGQQTVWCARELLEGYRLACSQGTECVEIVNTTLP